MPRPEKWFDNFLTELKGKGFNPDLPGTVDMVHSFTKPAEGTSPSTNDITFLFGGEGYDPNAALSSLTEEQQNKLYEAYEENKLYIKRPDANPFSYMKPYKTARVKTDNSVETTFHIDNIEGLPAQILAQGASDFNESLKTIKHFNRGTTSNRQELDDCCKTLTDMFKDAKLEELASSGLIRGRDGEEIAIPRGERPFDKYTVVLDNFNSQQGVYIQDLEGKKTVQVKRQVNGTIQKTPRDQLLVGKKLKEETIKQFLALATHIKRVKTENKDFKELQKNVDSTIETLKKTVHQDDFKKTVMEFSEKADMYYMKKVGTKMKTKGMTCLDIVNKVRNLRDCVEKDVVPSEDQKGEFLSLKEVLAGKYVRTYAATMAKYSKDPKVKEYAEQLKTDPKKFSEAVNKTMNSDTFAALYGNPKDPEALKRLRDGINMSPSDLFKTVRSEVKHPSAERIMHERIMNQPHQSVTQSMQRGPVSPDLKSDIAGVVAQMKGELQKIGNFGTNSPEYEKLMDVLSVADIRFKNGNNFMDVRSQMAEIAQAAEAYQNSHFGKYMNNRTASRTAVCEKLITAFKAMDKDQKPSEVMPSDVEIDQRLLARNIVEGSASKMMSSNNKALQEQGRLLQVDISRREKQIDKIIESDVFQKKYALNPEKIRDTLNKAPEAAFEKIISQQKKLNPDTIKNKIKAEKSPKKEEPKIKDQDTPMIV